MFMRVDKDLMFVVKSEIKIRPNTFVNSFVFNIALAARPKRCIDENWKTLHHFFEEACMTIIAKDHHIRSSKRFNYSEKKSRHSFFVKNLRLQIS